MRRNARINKAQLRMGIAVEMEHTKSKKVAKRIATDHLNEFRGVLYYTYLKRMERDMKKLIKKRNLKNL
jgi:hypothetical protein